MIINTNMASLNTIRQLGINEKNTQSSLAKLSSGLRINSAADDAAGLAISEKMRGQIAGLNQASSNAQTGINMVSTAEGALNETTSILQRMRELAVQASSDTNTTDDRTAMQTEMNQLTSEINRIGNTTQFNTQNLLKGKNTPVTTTAAAGTTLTQGAAGVAQGVLGSFTMNQSSVVGSASSTTVQASSSQTTATVSSAVSIITSSVAGVKSSLTLTNGITFETANPNGAVSYATTNGLQVEIKQAALGSGAAPTAITLDTTANKVTITIGTDANGVSLATNRGTLYNEINTAVTGFDAAAGRTKATMISVDTPSGTDSPVTDVTASGTFSGGVNETEGSYAVSLTHKFTEAGDTITIAGKTYTGVIGTADASKREFQIAATAAGVAAATVGSQVTSLLTALQADTDTSGHYTIAAVGGKLTFTENAGKATGTALALPTVAGAGTNDTLTVTNASGTNLTKVTLVQSATTAATHATTGKTVDTTFQMKASATGTELNNLKIAFSGLTNGGSGVLTSTYDAKTDTLNVTGDLGTLAGASTIDTAIVSAISSGLSAAGFQTGVAAVSFGASATAANAKTAFNNKTITFGSGTGSQLGTVAIANADTMKVDADSAGNLTIHLASTTASNNTAANIQAAIQALAITQHSAAGDLSKITATAGGNWDTATLGNSLTTASNTMVGGTAENKGDYTFEVATAFKAGDIAVIDGQKFTAVASGADAAKGQFNVSGGDVKAQAAGLADAISLNSVTNKYDVSVTGFKIDLTEKQASGTDLKATDLAVKATGTAGQYSIDTGAVNGNGGSFNIDGTTIKVSNKTANVGYANGTAIQVAASAADQTQELADAINKNATLSQKYTASVGNDGSLLLTQKAGEETSTAPSVQVTTAPVGDFTATLQIGANSGQTMTVNIGDMRSLALGISGDGSDSTVEAKDGSVASYSATTNVSNGTDNNNVEYALDISSSDKATAAISVIDDAINSVSSERSNLGAYQNRLEHTINNLGTASQNITASEASIRDVDMASEMTNFQKNNILQQAAQAMLAQANQQPQGVLQLLR